MYEINITIIFKRSRTQSQNSVHPPSIPQNPFKNQRIQIHTTLISQIYTFFTRIQLHIILYIPTILLGFVGTTKAIPNIPKYTIFLPLIYYIQNPSAYKNSLEIKHISNIPHPICLLLTCSYRTNRKSIHF